MNLTATSTTENGQRKVLLCTGDSCIEIEGDSALIVYFLSLNALCLLCVTLWGLRKIFVMIRAWCQNFLAHWAAGRECNYDGPHPNPVGESRGTRGCSAPHDFPPVPGSKLSVPAVDCPPPSSLSFLRYLSCSTETHLEIKFLFSLIHSHQQSANYPFHRGGGGDGRKLNTLDK